MKHIILALALSALSCPVWAQAVTNGYFTAVTGATVNVAIAPAIDSNTTMLITSNIVQFTSVAANSGAILPSGAPIGYEWTIYNDTATALLIYPFSGANFQGLATNAALTIATNVKGLTATLVHQ